MWRWLQFYLYESFSWISVFFFRAGWKTNKQTKGGMCKYTHTTWHTKYTLVSFRIETKFFGTALFCLCPFISLYLFAFFGQNISNHVIDHTCVVFRCGVGVCGNEMEKHKPLYVRQAFQEPLNKKTEMKLSFKFSGRKTKNKEKNELAFVYRWEQQSNEFQ